MERIQSHVPLDDLDGSRRVSRIYQRFCETPVREIRMEGHGPLELRDRHIMLASATEGLSEHDMCLREIGIELHGPAGLAIRPVEGSRVQIVTIQCVDPGGYMRPGKPGVGARVVGVDR